MLLLVCSFILRPTVRVPDKEDDDENGNNEVSAMVRKRMPLSTITAHSRQRGLVSSVSAKQDLILLQIGLGGTPASAIATFFCLSHFHWPI